LWIQNLLDFKKKTIVNLSIFKISHSNKIKIKIKIHTL
jgi:hypothetical protein